MIRPAFRSTRHREARDSRYRVFVHRDWFCTGADRVALNPPHPTVGTNPVPADLVTGEIDWNCSGSFTDPGTVAEDINADGGQTALTGHDDWSNLGFDGGVIADIGDVPVVLPTETEADEITVAEDALIPKVFAVAIMGPGDQVVAPDELPPYRYELSNEGETADIYDLYVARVLCRGLPGHSA